MAIEIIFSIKFKMRELFSLCLLAFLFVAAFPAIIITQTVPSVIQINQNKFIITIDEPKEAISKVTTTNSKNTGLLANGLPHEAKTSQSSKALTQKADESIQNSQLLNIAQFYDAQPQSHAESVNSNSKAQHKNAGTVTISSSSNTRSASSQTMKSSSIQSSTRDKNPVISQQIPQNGNDLSTNSKQVSSTSSTNPVITNSPKTPMVGLTQTTVSSPVIGLANPKSS